jgi:hypothetical protein
MPSGVLPIGVIFPVGYKAFPFEEQNFVETDIFGITDHGFLFRAGVVWISPQRISSGGQPFIDGADFLEHGLSKAGFEAVLFHLRNGNCIQRPERNGKAGFISPDKDALSSHYPVQVQMITHYK